MNETWKNNINLGVVWCPGFSRALVTPPLLRIVLGVAYFARHYKNGDPSSTSLRAKLVCRDGNRFVWTFSSFLVGYLLKVENGVFDGNYIFLFILSK